VDSRSASGSFVHTPCGPRKSGIPESVEIPAPVRTTTRFASSRRLRAVPMWSATSGVGTNRNVTASSSLQDLSRCRPVMSEWPVSNMDRLEQIVARLPEAERVDIEAWGGEPTFRVRGKNFIFSSHDGSRITVKLPKTEAAAVTATDPSSVAAPYGLARHGWISVSLSARMSKERWREIEEWIRTSYSLVAPKHLARQVLDQDRQRPD
jgi:predicted DNA-binding protein (MmcQ/YjbR family)